MIVAPNISHYGVGFICGNLKFDLDYDAIKGMGNAVFPTINSDEIIWNNDAEIQLNINRDWLEEYWERSNYLATITVKQFNILLKSIFEDFMPVNSKYELYDVINEKGKYQVKSSTCATFVDFVFDFLPNKNLMTRQLTINFDIFSEQKNIQTLDVDKPKHKKMIRAFYEKLTVNYSGFIKNIPNIPSQASALLNQIIRDQNKDIVEIIDSINTLLDESAAPKDKIVAINNLNKDLIDIEQNAEKDLLNDQKYTELKNLLKVIENSKLINPTKTLLEDYFTNTSKPSERKKIIDTDLKAIKSQFEDDISINPFIVNKYDYDQKKMTYYSVSFDTLVPRYTTYSTETTSGPTIKPKSNNEESTLTRNILIGSLILLVLVILTLYLINRKIN